MDLSKTNYINSVKYLPTAFQDNEYYLKICSLIDSLISDNSKYFLLITDKERYNRTEKALVVNALLIK